MIRAALAFGLLLMPAAAQASLYCRVWPHTAQCQPPLPAAQPVPAPAPAVAPPATMAAPLVKPSRKTSRPKFKPAPARVRAKAPKSRWTCAQIRARAAGKTKAELDVLETAGRLIGIVPTAEEREFGKRCLGLK